ncbi:MAG TPA: lamin tail domain-containing protein [Minicystis sp.]|nr:lamin tail domain-containing protein [Minicystis sp.]
MNASRHALFALLSFVLASAGCELLARVDRSQIPNGSGGAGGATASSSSSAGGAPECTDASQCPAPSNACESATCDGGTCGKKPAAKGAKATQVAGNCKREQCDGQGHVESVVDDTDVPNDGKSCTDDACDNGVPSNPNTPKGQKCGSGDQLVCDGNGHCVTCNVASDCGTDTDCQTWACNAGTCVPTNTPAGTAVSDQTAGDCLEVQCDGNGGTMPVDDNADVPVDGNDCTQDLCANGTPSNPPEDAGTTCGNGGIGQCDGSGHCVECLAPADCPGQDDECQTRTCTNGTCGFSFQPLGTLTAVQTSGDCKKHVCDGMGGQTDQNDDGDVPDDDNPCTTDACSGGVASHTPVNDGTSCGNGLQCTAGVCTGCATAGDCPGQDTDCKGRACNAGACGFAFTAQGTPTSQQTAHDCLQNQCDGAGNVVSAPLDTDVPVDDGNACTDETCSNGAPQHPPSATGTTCSQNGGIVCDGASHCVACNVPSDCGTVTECRTPTCVAHVCGENDAAAGTVTTNQTPGDCRQNQCDGSGGITSVPDNSDVPADDGNPCTNDTCSNGAPQHPPKQNGTTCDDGNACTQTDTCQGGTCTGGNAVTCTAADQCHDVGACNPQTGQCSNPAKTDGASCNDGNACTQADTCQAGVCTGGSPVTCTAADQCHVAGACDPGTGMCSNPAATDGTPCSDGDLCTQNDTCQAGTCTGGSPVTCTAADPCHVAGTCDPGTGTCTNPAATDGTPCNDGDLCTQSDTCQAGACTAGTPVTGTPADECHTAGTCDSGTGLCSNPPVADGTPCTGGVCEVGVCQPTPTVVSTTPADATTGVSTGTTIAVTFNTAMNPATLTAKSTLDSGACSGSVQVSTDGFTTCIPMSGPVMTGGNTIATFTPTLALSYGEVFQIKVTTAATSGVGLALAADFTTPSGFTSTLSYPVVMSQIYGAGGNNGATYNHDFVELYNRGNVAVNLSGWSIQYASATGSSWQAAALSGTIPPGGYFLVQLAGGATGANLPTPDLSGFTLNMSGSQGKVALVNSTTLLTGTCPAGGTIVDFIGYGPTANCYEGTGPAGQTGGPSSAQRAGAGCTDANDNASDFTIAAPAPRNSATPAASCGADPLVLNETDLTDEIDFCTVQFPHSLSVQTGTDTGEIYCQVYETGVTPTGGTLDVELGYGPPTANPESQTGWTWLPMTYNTMCTGCGNNDEYMASFTAPAAGDYRYVCRVKTGSSYTYCDVFGAGSNPGQSFETPWMAPLTVTP